MAPPLMGPLGTMQPMAGAGMPRQMPGRPQLAPPAPTGPTGAPVQPPGGGPGKQAKAAVIAGIVMSALIKAAADAGAGTEDAEAFLKAYQDLSKRFRKGTAELDTAGIDALKRTVSGPGPATPGASLGLQSAIGNFKPPAGMPAAA